MLNDNLEKFLLIHQSFNNLIFSHFNKINFIMLKIIIIDNASIASLNFPILLNVNPFAFQD